MAEAGGRLAQALEAMRAGRHAEAAAALRRIVAARPKDADAARALSEALAQTGEHEQAVFYARRAIAADQRDARAWNNLGRALLALGRFDEAVEAHRSALAAAPDDADELASLCTALQAAGRLRDAIDAARLGAERHEGHAGLAATLAGALCDAGITIEPRRILDRIAPAMRDSLSFAAVCCSSAPYAAGLTPARAREPFDAYGDLLERLAPRRATVHPNDRDPERRLRVGFLSPDLREHPVGMFMERPLEFLDRSAFEVVVYSTAPREDAASARFRAMALAWKPVAALDANALARLIFADKVDVLIELSGHSAGGRLSVLHAGPAPVQATYLGFPSTTGVRAIGWRIVDSITDPPGMAEAWGCERLIRVDPCFLCYRPPAEAVAPPVEPSRRGVNERPIVFGSCNSISKINEDVVALWARLLRETPGSALLLKHLALGHEQGREMLAARFAEAGVDPSRLDLRGHSPFRDLLDTYNEIDVALDPFPFNGATTTCDALFMGVPTVTLEGDRSCARVGMSVLGAAGLSDLVARGADDYVRIASALAADRERLATLRATLRGRLLASPLCDGPGFAAALGGAIRAMWREYCAGHG